MPTVVRLQPTMSYGYFPLIVLFLILVLSLVLKSVIKKKKRKEGLAHAEGNGSKVISPVPVTVQDRYIKELRKVLKDYNGNKRDERECYQLLSYYLRAFFKEYAGINVESKTLAEIRGLSTPKLEALIEEYYECEFAPDKTGDVEKIVEKTISEIRNW